MKNPSLEPLLDLLSHEWQSLTDLQSKLDEMPDIWPLNLRNGSLYHALDALYQSGEIQRKIAIILVDGYPKGSKAYWRISIKQMVGKLIEKKYSSHFTDE